MEVRTSGTFAALAALAVGGLLLSDRVRFRQGDTPAVSVQRHLDVQLPVGKALVIAAALLAGALLVSKQFDRTRASRSRSSVQETIELDVPVSTAYNQWTQFEEFPLFMTSVEEVKQLDDTHLHWRAHVAGKTKEWDAEITEQIPDTRIAWRSTGGVRNAGAVSFDKVADNRTRVTLRMDYDPQTLGEKLADAAGGVKLTTRGNLKRFKELVERRGVETGGWRGTVAPH
jgi:uncharacterized membrane protein